MLKNILITGCSGGGKSTLLAALDARGHKTVLEPGLRIVSQERESGGTALPWVDLSAFLHRAAQMARRDLDQNSQAARPVFYDRGLFDAAVGLHHLHGTPLGDTMGPIFPYDQRTLVAPPWPKLFSRTQDRQHSFDQAVAEYHRIKRAIALLGCTEVPLPLSDVQARVAFVERHFSLGSPKPDA
jgi:predicted ATPase